MSRVRLSREEIRAILDSRAPRLRGAFVSVIYQPRARGFACACIVSKKVAARAHERNLIKRRCRAALKVHAGSLPFAIILRAEARARAASYEEIDRDVHDIMRRVR